MLILITKAKIHIKNTHEMSQMYHILQKTAYIHKKRGDS